MITTATQNVLDIDRSGLTETIFSEYPTELAWTALFLTADESMAAACLIDATSFPELQVGSPEESLKEWARYATIGSAVQMQQGRISQLSSGYEKRSCTHGHHVPLSQDSMNLVVDETSAILAKLDVLCRCALAICGIMGRPTYEAALLLGINEASVRAAYCTALEYLEVLACERFREENEYAAVWN